MVLARFCKWFSSRGQHTKVRPVPTTRLQLESLERREVPAYIGGVTLPAPTLPTAQVATQTVTPTVSTLNQQIVSYLGAHLNQKVGGGECAQLAQEALRVAGANFTPQNPYNNGSYVWGKLLTTITAGNDSSPTVVCQPGDIIQLQNVRLSNGWSFSQHTAIVAAVDSQGRPTQVYEQNVWSSNNGSMVDTRYDRLDSLAFNKNTVVAGTVHIYRAVPRTDSTGKVQFSVVNDTNQAQAVTVYLNGVKQGTLNLVGTFNTWNSYQTAWFSNSRLGTWTIGVNGQKVTLKNAGGYELYTTSTGQSAIRAI